MRLPGGKMLFENRHGINRTECPDGKAFAPQNIGDHIPDILHGDGIDPLENGAQWFTPSKNKFLHGDVIHSRFDTLPADQE